MKHGLMICVTAMLLLNAAGAGAQSRRQAQYASSKQLFSDALRNNPNDVNALFNLSRLHLDMMEVDSAQILLDRALSIEPENAQFLVERARVHLEHPEHINIGDTRGYLEKAIKIDPNLLQAQYYLAIAYIYPVRGRRLLDEARVLLNAVMEVNPRYKDALFFSVLAESLGKTGAAATTQFEAIIRSQPNHGEAGVRLAEILFASGGDPAQACGLYLAGLEHLRNPVELSRIEKETRILFTREEAQTYNAVTIPRRGGYLARYWRAQDPTPGTLVNECLVEQFRRLNYARTNFSTDQGELGFDDRGMVYVKYGEPDDKYLGYHEMEYSANESWTYFSIDPYLAFDFVDRGGYFSKAMDLRDAMVFSRYGETAAAGDLNYEEGYMYFWDELKKLYEKRVDLGGIYAKLGLKGMGYRGADHEFEQMFEAGIDLRSKAITDAPPVHFQYDYDRNTPLDFLYQNGMFRSQDGLTRFEVYYGIPLDQMKFANQQGDMVLEPVELTVAFTDKDHRPVQTFPSKVNVTFPAGVDQQKAYFVNQSAYDLPPGNYGFAISIKAPESNLWGILKDSIRVVDYSNNTQLAVSSLQMTPQITQPPIIDEAQYKGGYAMVPHPSMAFKQSDQSYVFYEIYNLTLGPDGRTDYEVEVTLQSIQGGGFIRSALGRLFTRRQDVPAITLTESGSSSMRTDRRATALDLSRVPDGEMLMTLKVTDKISGKSASSEQVFIVEKFEQR